VGLLATRRPTERCLRRFVSEAHEALSALEHELLLAFPVRMWPRLIARRAIQHGVDGSVGPALQHVRMMPARRSTVRRIPKSQEGVISIGGLADPCTPRWHPVRQRDLCATAGSCSLRVLCYTKRTPSARRPNVRSSRWLRDMPDSNRWLVCRDAANQRARLQVHSPWRDGRCRARKLHSSHRPQRLWKVQPP